MGMDFQNNLTAHERAVLEEPALKQQALALVAATEFATRVGMGEEAQAALMDGVRQFDKAEAKTARQAFRTLNTLMEASGVTVTPVTESQVAPPPTTAQSKSIKPKRPTQVAVPLTRQVEAEDRIAASIEQLVKDEAISADLREERVQSILNAFAQKGITLPLTAADVSHKTIEGLARLYAGQRGVDEEVAKVNSMCTWGWLAGVDMQELVIWRDRTKPNATAVDVHNSRAAFVSGVTRGWKAAWNRGEDPLQALIATAQPAEDGSEYTGLTAVPRLIEEQHEVGPEAPLQVVLHDGVPNLVKI